MAEMTRRRRNYWGRFLLIWAILLLILGAALCFVLYRYLEVYEITRPEPVMDRFLQDYSASQLLDRARENVQLELTEFDDPDALFASYLNTIDTTRTLSYRADSRESDETHLAYVIHSGPSELCTVVLTPDGSSPGFGRHAWRVSEIRSAPITEILSSVRITVDALSGTELLLNDRPLTDQYLVDEISSPNLSRFEAGLDPLPSFVRYEVGPLYGEVRLTDTAGNTFSPDGDTASGTLHYQASSGERSLTVRAPEDLRVFVNGVELTSQELVSSGLGVLEGLDVYTGDAACRTNLYRVDGLYMPATVSAVEADGTVLTPVASAEDSFTFFHSGEAETEEILRPSAELFFSAYMDYSANAYEATRFYNLLNRILPGTGLYEYVFSSREAMYWASGTSTSYRDLRYENFHRISDYCSVCTVIYSADMTATSWYEQYSYSLENAYELAFVSDGGFWYAAGMDVIAGS